MDDTVLELGELAAVPAVGGADEVACDALQAVDVVAVAAGALVEVIGSVLIAAIHAAVAVVVDRTVAHVVLVHQVHDIGDGFGIVGGVTVNLDIEDMSATGQLMVGSLDLGLVLGRALVIDRHVVAVGIIDFVGHSGDFAEVLAVTTGELARETLGRRCQHTVVVLVALAELVDTVAHIGDNLDTQLLCLVALAVMMAHEGNQALGKADKADAQGALVDDTFHTVVGAEFAGTVPQLRHEQRELLCHGSLLVLEARIKLTGSDFQHIVELGKEAIDALLLVLDTHALDGQLDDIDGRERQVAAAD